MDGMILRELFENEGPALQGAAIKLANRYGIDVDDVAQEIAVAALETRRQYGFVHINTSVNRAKDALLRTNAYGPNLYQLRQGRHEISLETDDGSSESGDPWALSFADEGFDWALVDTALSVRQIYATIEDATDRRIVDGLALGLGPVEISSTTGLHYSSVIRRRDKGIAEAFKAVL